MTFTVYGLPQPKGSMKYIGHHGGKPRLKSTSKGLPAWDEAVHWEAVKACGTTPAPFFPGPVRVRIVFTMPRPASSPKSRMYPDTKPDIDKLARAVLDSMKRAGVYVDDSRVCSLIADKRFPLDPLPITRYNAWELLDRPGTVITVVAL